METNYPWTGKMKFNIDPAKNSKFKLYLRVPGWAQGQTSTSGLYSFLNFGSPIIYLKVNGKDEAVRMENGYIVINREWKKGDVVTYELPMQINKVLAREELKQDKNRVAIQRGPIVYCIEGADNNSKAWDVIIPENTKFETKDYKILDENVKALTAEVPVVTVGADGISLKTEMKKIIAIPYYTWANRGKNEMQVWLPTKITDVKLNY
jgi:DUF1680 family protein